MTRLERNVARPWKGRAILCSQCFRELFPDLCESVADEERTALVAGDAGGHIGGVMAARLGFGGGKIPQRAVRQLDEEGLFRGALGPDPVAVIQKEFEGIGGDGDIPEPHHMDLRGEDHMILLILVLYRRSSEKEERAAELQALTELRQEIEAREERLNAAAKRENSQRAADKKNLENAAGGVIVKAGAAGTRKEKRKHGR